MNWSEASDMSEDEKSVVSSSTKEIEKKKVKSNGSEKKKSFTHEIRGDIEELKHNVYIYGSS